MQLFFLAVEFGEMAHSGFLAYMQDMWNWLDATQYFFMMGSIYFNNHRKHGTEDQNDDERFYFEFCEIIVVLQSAMKFMKLIVYDENFCFLVEMLF